MPSEKCQSGRNKLPPAMSYYRENAEPPSHAFLPFWTRFSPRNCLMLTILCFLSVFVVAMLATKSQYRHRITNNVHRPSCDAEKAPVLDQDEIRNALFSSIDPARMASTLRLLTQEPHQAGTEANRRVAKRLAKLWQQIGLEKVRLLEYDVLLSYPNWTTPNHASVLSDQGKVLFQSTGLSPDLIPPDGSGNDYRASIQWLAYSADGTVEGQPVYCHYGRPQDFERLEKEFGMADLKGKIALIRYGEDFRGDKVKHAQERHAAGVILFSDPAEVAPGGGVFPDTDHLPAFGVQRGSLMEDNGDPTTPLLPSRRDFHRQKTVGQVILPSSQVASLPFPTEFNLGTGSGSENQSIPKKRAFPHTDWMPPGGVQRGSVMSSKGDPLTPLLPARKDFQRGKTVQQVIEEGRLPSIPVLPLGYADVEKILARMAGPLVPEEWQGGIGIPYKLGPGFLPNQGDKLRLEVHSKLDIRTIQNVVGVIRGREEPDSWVLLGNHYDAWVFGAIDPNSGSTILAEVARAFAEAAQRGWRPRRSLMFCAWDGEEHGLIGSTEFVQEYAELLRDRAVVYLNVDLISSNQSLDVRTVPSLYKIVTDTAKLVRNPVAEERAKGRQTVFDSWRAHFPPDISWLPDTPKMDLPGGGSDHMSFLNFLGIPVVDFTYRNAHWKSYPLYHSRYEVPFVNEHLFDHDNLAVHKAVGEYWAELARAFADSPVLPISASIFARRLLQDYLAQVQQSLLTLHAKFPAETAPALLQMANLLRQSQLFLQQAKQFEQDAKLAKPDWMNRRLRKLEQCFVNPAMGLAEKEPEKRHVLFSLSDDDSYSASVMAAVQQKISAVSHEADAQKRTEFGRQLALQLTVVQYSVLCATDTLKQFP